MPKGRSGLFGGSEPTPGDGQQDEWSRQALERMDSYSYSSLPGLSQRGHQGCRGHVVDKRSAGPVGGHDKTSGHVLA